jgi:hypothetical protein
MSKSVALAIKQLRQAASNLAVESSDGASTWRETARFGRALCEQIANALEMGPSYLTAPRAEDFDTANAKET